MAENENQATERQEKLENQPNVSTFNKKKEQTSNGNSKDELEEHKRLRKKT